MARGVFIDRPPEDVRASFETLGFGPDDIDLLVVSDAQEILSRRRRLGA